MVRSLVTFPFNKIIKDPFIQLFMVKTFVFKLVVMVIKLMHPYKVGFKVIITIITLLIDWIKHLFRFLAVIEGIMLFPLSYFFMESDSLFIVMVEGYKALFFL